MRDIYAPIHTNESPRLMTFAGLKVREDTLYTNREGEEKSGIRKRAEKALQRLQEPLRRVLGTDEAVLYVAYAQAPVSTLEQLTLGWYLYYVSRCLLVLTNRRLLQVHVKRQGGWDGRLRSLAWGDVAEAKVQGLLNLPLRLKYHDGRKETYWGLRRADGKKIQSLLESLLPASASESTAAQGATSLCPRCLSPLTARVYQCAKCAMKFKDERSMLWRFLLIPGGGYFYVRHWFLGVMDFLAEIFFLLVALFWVLIALGVVQEAPRPGESPASAAEALIVVVFIVVALGIKKGVTIYHCQRRIREFIPAE
jgi:hypothetical protein